MDRTPEITEIRTEELLHLPRISFRASGEKPAPGLLASIERSGIMRPLTLVRLGSERILLSGGRRLQAALNLQIETAPVELLPESEDLIECAKALYLENGAQAECKPLEKARFFHTLTALAKDFHLALDEGDLLELLELPPGSWVAPLLHKAAELPPVWQNFLVEKNVPFRRMRNLLKSRILKQMGFLLEEGCGLNRTEKILVLLEEISTQQSCPEEQVLKRVLTEVPEQDKSRADRCGDILKRLEALRYPLLTRLREQRQEQLRTLDPPSFLNLNTDPGFESEILELRAGLKSEKDLFTLEQWLKGNREQLRQILDRNHILTVPPLPPGGSAEEAGK